jgi:hypothetical protein
MTTWEKIPNFSRYEVTDSAQFRNAKTGRLLESKINLTADCGKRKTVYANVAVLNAFVGDIPAGAVVLYRDRQKSNCRLPNLGLLVGDEFVHFEECGDGYRQVRTPVLCDLTRLPLLGECRNGHRLSLTGLPDANTLFWSGGRICRQCDAPNGLPAPDARHIYNKHFGTALAS